MLGHSDLATSALSNRSLPHGYWVHIAIGASLVVWLQHTLSGFCTTLATPQINFWTERAAPVASTVRIIAGTHNYSIQRQKQQSNSLLNDWIILDLLQGSEESMNTKAMSKCNCDETNVVTKLN